MFDKFRQRLRDAQTIKTLCIEAEKLANRDAQKPGAEHFILAALALPDATARGAFARLHASPEDFRAAIGKQYQDALSKIGIEAPVDVMSASNAHDQPSPRGLYHSQASSEALMQTLTTEVMPRYHREFPYAPLLGAHVVLAAATSQYGVTARALRAMGIDPQALAEASKEVIASNRSM